MKVIGIDEHVFRLSSLAGLSIPDLYYMTKDGVVYSRSSGEFRKLKGSTNSSGTYYKLGYRTITKAQLLQHAMRHKDWSTSFTDDHRAFKAHPMTIVPKVAARIPGRSHASTTEDGVNAKGAIIARVHKGNLVFGSAPVIHLTEDSVRAELLALATRYPGTKFVRLNIAESVVAGGVVWK